MGAIRILVTGDYLLRSLHLDDDDYHRILDVKKCNSTFDTIEIYISGDKFPSVEYGEEPILVTPIIHHESYTVDWDLPKENK